MDKVLHRHPSPPSPGEDRGDRATAAVAATPALVVDRLCRSFGPVRAVVEVSLSMAPGEIIALLGHSGSGKSTLLRLIAGLDRGESGGIVIYGRDVNSPFVPPEARGVGMMFQDYALFPHLTVLANLTFGLNRLPRAEAAERARRALARIGLAGRQADYPHRLSGGEQQRVALARALLPRPKILLMDEPFSNLDRRTRDLVRDETSAVLRESGATAILVTHDPDDAMRMADRIMLMHAGRIAGTGTAEELYHRPASLLAARFFSDFNEIDGVCRHGMVATALGNFAASGLADGVLATVCIRPRDLVLDLSPGAGGLAGRVVSRAFHGDAQLVTVAVDGLSPHLAVEAPLDATPEAGHAVAISVAVKTALVFPAE
ncbi:MAG: ABC transporter ATP-binding protein [Bauldia sp.]